MSASVSMGLTSEGQGPESRVDFRPLAMGLECRLLSKAFVTSQSAIVAVFIASLNYEYLIRDTMRSPFAITETCTAKACSHSLILATEQCFGLDFAASSKFTRVGMSSAISTKAPDSIRSISCSRWNWWYGCSNQRFWWLIQGWWWLIIGRVGGPIGFRRHYGNVSKV